MEVRQFLFQFVAMLLLLAGIVCAESPVRRVRVGLMASLSGQAAMIGAQCQDGFDAARKNLTPDGKLGDIEVEYISADHRADGLTAVNEFQKLVSINKVDAVLTHFSQATMQVNPLSHKLELPLLSAVGQADFVRNNPYAFRFFPSTDHEAAALFNLFKEWELKRPALVSVQDEYALSLKGKLAELLNGISVEPVIDIEALKDELDLNALATRVLAAKPDSVFLNLAISQLVPFVRKLKSSGFTGKIIGNVWLAFQDVQQQAKSGELDGAVFALIDSSRFATDGSATSPGKYCCYSMLAALLQGISSINGEVNKASINEAMNRMTEVKMPGESLPFVGRETQYRLKMMVYRNGQVESWERGTPVPHVTSTTAFSP